MTQAQATASDFVDGQPSTDPSGSAAESDRTAEPAGSSLEPSVDAASAEASVPGVQTGETVSGVVPADKAGDKATAVQGSTPGNAQILMTARLRLRMATQPRQPLPAARWVAAPRSRNLRPRLALVPISPAPACAAQPVVSAARHRAKAPAAP